MYKIYKKGDAYYVVEYNGLFSSIKRNDSLGDTLERLMINIESLPYNDDRIENLERLFSVNID